MGKIIYHLKIKKAYGWKMHVRIRNEEKKSETDLYFATILNTNTIIDLPQDDPMLSSTQLEFLKEKHYAIFAAINNKTKYPAFTAGWAAMRWMRLGMLTRRWIDSVGRTHSGGRILTTRTHDLGRHAPADAVGGQAAGDYCPGGYN